MNEIRTESFGARLARLREDAGLSQSALAKRISASQSAISQLEAGDRNPSYTMLCDLAEALGVSTAYLVGAEVEGLNEEEEALFRRYRSLSPEDRRELTEYSEYLHSRHGRGKRR